MNTRGFTLLEVLTVIAVLGILMAIATPSYLAYLQRLTVQQGVQQFARDVDRARSQARRTNSCRIFSVVGPSSYQIQSYASPNCAGTPITETLNMPAGTQLTLKSVQGSASFRPPYGVNFTAMPVDVTVASTSHVNVTRTLRITAVMGSVVIQ
ncbi:hypothetical protein GCM10010840_16420 [Deinococcus aerolatus]|uniref:Prepilin-type N-terminal cleavage/methylation domain-containing protein n=1 Tax=Deinococcus aerolatus TaxID=522487 RepID=A0ABQ2G813_9DEIO|nr:type II secretion system protein [Deinococcus aerolatus]GGL79268.1 hypothetical protein GCM10010840_16420 [Deinococcus aerolatus]